MSKKQPHFDGILITKEWDDPMEPYFHSFTIEIKMEDFRDCDRVIVKKMNFKNGFTVLVMVEPTVFNKYGDEEEKVE